ncbi:(Fe-S)-binding protein [Magnetofaba australis]|uniref:Glycolate oxidase iron-sulfur subunit n=1 Tax=Magnetofaba australis IT-1 TaxID=1434232 RepID=A0A1Y2K3P3_9PROT|nr:(Fe-S)-binding protein [Magnetofaba australis]OSM01764.1 hypothetical protein MAIT1_01797 [Magnetofaba australis IT-1]
MSLLLPQAPVNLRYKQFKNAQQCTHCGYCLPVCPTYRVENVETQSPRGRVSAVLALASGELEPQEAVDLLAHCIGCRACHAACPVGVRPGKLSLQARSLAPLESGRFETWLHAITDSAKLARMASRALDLAVSLGAPRWPLGPLKRIAKLIPQHRPKPPAATVEGAGDEVVLLSGCMARLFMPHVAESAANVLRSMGFRVRLVSDFGCCGAPHRERGDKATLHNNVERVLDAVAIAGPETTVITDSSVCAITIRAYGKSLPKDHARRGEAEGLSGRVKEFTEFLAEHVAQLPAGAPGSGDDLAWHDHCQARFGLDIVEPPRVVLDRCFPGWRDVPENGQCCGAGGEYMLRHGARSAKIRAEKLACVAQTGAGTVTGVNPGCLVNMGAGGDKQTRHLAELLAEHVRGAGTK